MGIYVYSKKQLMKPFEQQIPSSANTSAQRGASSTSRPGMTQKSQGYSTVTAFNTVHFDCHNNAVRSHRGRDEWESATLQNADVKCNGILPMWGNQVIESQFAHSLSKFNSHLQDCTGFREPNYQSTVHDCKLLFLKFAEEKSFSEDCHGGARESNARLIPYLFTIALYVINSTRSSTREEILIKQFIQEPADKWARNAFEVEGVHFYATMQLLIMKQNVFWEKNKLLFLQRLIACLHVRSLYSSTSGIQSPININPVEKEYSVYKSGLMFFTMINNIVKLFTKLSFTSTAARPWSEDLIQYLRSNDAQMLENLDKRFVANFEEALAAESFAEWCDIVGLISDIGAESVDTFIANTLRSICPKENQPQP